MKNLDITTSNRDNPSISARTAPKVKRFFSKRRLVYLLKFAITGLVMAMLLKNLKMTNITSAFEQANHSYILVAFLLIFLNIYIQYFKWRFLLRLIKPQVSAKESLRSLLVGFTFGFITPGRVGEFGRAFFIKDCSWIKVLGITFIDKFFSLSVVIFAGAIGLLSLIWKQLHFYVLLPLTIFTLIVLLLLRYLLIHPDIFRGFLYKLNIILPFREKIKLLSSSFDHFHKKQALQLLGYSILFYFIFLTQYLLLTAAFESISLFANFQAISSTLLVKSMLPISVGDLGIRESAAIFFFTKIGIKSTTAFNASILIFTINILIPSLIGLVLVLKNRLINLYDNSL